MVQEVENVRHQSDTIQILLKHVQNIPGDQIQFIQFVLGHQLAEVTHEWSAGTVNLRDNKLGHKQYSRCCLINANAYQTLRETADAGNKSGDDGFAVSVESHNLLTQIETFLLGQMSSGGGGMMERNSSNCSM